MLYFQVTISQLMNANYEIAFIIRLITVIVAYNFVYSRTGRAVMSIRDNRIAAESIGINITKYKLITFGLTAFLAGVAGVIYSHNFSTLQAVKFDYNMSILVLVFVVLVYFVLCRKRVIFAVFSSSPVFWIGNGKPCCSAKVFTPPCFIAQAMLCGELSQCDPASGIDDPIPVGAKRLSLFER